MFTCILPILFGCREQDLEGVYKELSSEKFTQAFQIPGYQIEVRYVPSLLEVFNQLDAEKGVKNEKRSLAELKLIAANSKNTIFILNIKPMNLDGKTASAKDLIYSDVASNEELESKLNEFYFGMQNKIWIEFDGVKYPIAKFQMENTFGLSTGRDFILVFSRLDKIAIQKKKSINLVLDNIVPGLARKRIEWHLPIGKYDK